MSLARKTTVAGQDAKPGQRDFAALVVGRPNIGDRRRFLDRVEDILDRRWLSNGGAYVQEFEQRVAKFLEVEHCVAMCNATVGLEIAIRALDLAGEVIVPSFTFVATAHALQWQEITPVFCDVDPVTHNIDPAQVEKLITPRTTGILGVHLWGRACDVVALEDIARKHSLRLMYDASHAFACSHNGRMIGGFGDAEVFSFHATKFINTFEGGVVTTNSAELATKIRLMKNFGFTDYDRVDYLGVNGKMHEVSAAMGITNLEAIDNFIAANLRNYQIYKRELSEIPGVELLSYEDHEKHNYQYVVVTITEGLAHLSRDEIMRVLDENDIFARRYFFPGCHRHAPYRSEFVKTGRTLPVTERLSGDLICLPSGSTVQEDDIVRVCKVIQRAVKSAAR
jgi:dTDP-4-amino-4,6-dideoxygalactose transaminase